MRYSKLVFMNNLISKPSLFQYMTYKSNIVHGAIMLKNKALRIKVKNVLPYAILMLLNLRVLTWFEGGKIIASGDFRIPLNPNAYFKNTLYLWNEIDFGIPSVYMPRLTDLLSTFIALFNTLGLNLAYSEMAAIYIIETMAMILMYEIIFMLSNNRLAAFVGAIFFGSNLYMINDREATAVGWFASNLIFLLPSIYFFTKGILQGKYRYCLLGGILAVFAFSAFPNYRPYIVLVSITVSILVFKFFKDVLRVVYFKEKNILNLQVNIKLLKNLINAYVAYLGGTLISAFGIIYLILSMMNFLLKHHREAAVPVFILKYLRLSDVLRLIAKWGFYEKAFNKPYVPYRELYLQNPIFIALSYVPLLIIVLSLIMCKRNKMILYFFALHYLGSLILIALPKIIGEESYIGLFENIAFLRAFRESFNFIYFAVLYGSIVLGVGVSEIYHRLKHIKTLNSNTLPYVIPCTIVLLIILSTLPLYTGSIAINWINPKVKGACFSREYILIQSILPGEYWSLLLPEREVYQVFNFSNAPLALGNPHPLIFDKPYISGTGTEYVRSRCLRLIKEIYHKLHQEQNCCNVLAFFCIKSLVYEKKLILGKKEDIDVTYLRKLPCVKGEILLNTLNVYYVENALDIIRVTDSVRFVDTIDDMLRDIEHTSINDLSNVVFYVNETLYGKMNAHIQYCLKSTKFIAPSQISWSKISPTLYVINIENSKGPFILLLFTSYDEFWKVYINGKEVPEKYHFIANGFFNGWIITHPKRSFTITIRYTLQEYLALIMVFSVIILAVLFIVIKNSEYISGDN